MASEFTLCPSQTRDLSPNINLNALNSASGRWKPTCTICFVHLISTYPECQPSTPFSPHLYKLLLSPPFLGCPFPLPFLWLNSSYRMNLWEEENTSWPKTKPGQVWQQTRHILTLGQTHAPANMEGMVLLAGHLWGAQAVPCATSLEMETASLCYWILLAFPFFKGQGKERPMYKQYK